MKKQGITVLVSVCLLGALAFVRQAGNHPRFSSIPQDLHDAVSDAPSIIGDLKNQAGREASEKIPGLVPVPVTVQDSMDGCMPTYAWRCPCRPNCEQDYCEKYCRLCGSSPTECQYCCGGCGCGAVGKCDGPGGWLDFAAGLIASSAQAADSAKKDDGAREYANAHGDFLIVPRKSAPRSAASGIGVRVIKNGGVLSIAEVFKGSPAEEAGLVPGDIIVSINERPAAKLGLAAAGKALRGGPGSRVRLEVRGKNGETKRLEVARSDSAFSAASAGSAIAFLSIPSRGEAACAPKAGKCLFLYKDKEACHYTCQKPDVGKAEAD